MDYKVDLSKEIRPVYPGIGIRPIGQKEGKGQGKDFRETLKEKQEKVQGKGPADSMKEEEGKAKELQEDLLEGTKGKKINIIA